MVGLDDTSPIRRRRLAGKDRDSIVRYLRELAGKLGKDTLTRYDIRKDGELNQATIHRKFGGFSEALIQAGLRPGRIYKRNAGRMIRDLADLMRELGREPRKSEMDKGLTYRTRHYEREFGSLANAFDLAEDALKSDTRQNQEAIGSSAPRLRRTRPRRRYGPAIEFRSLRHAPINEQGVVFLFGMLAEELGYQVESVQDGFPDCDAKVKRPDGTFERVTIEFEFRSSEFVRHRHHPEDCDVLVCWQHDWKDCPRSVTVVELSKVVAGRGPYRPASRRRDQCQEERRG